jgi:hypothetical protein
MAPLSGSDSMHYHALVRSRRIFARAAAGVKYTGWIIPVALVGYLVFEGRSLKTAILSRARGRHLASRTELVLDRGSSISVSH